MIRTGAHQSSMATGRGQLRGKTGDPLWSSSQGQAFLEDRQDRGVAAWNVGRAWPLCVAPSIAGVREDTVQSQFVALLGEDLLVVIATAAQSSVCGLLQERMGPFMEQDSE